MSDHKDVVTMAHGSGGRAMQQMIERLFLSAFDNPWLSEREDAARLPIASLSAQGDRLAFTTDSYVIDPVFFPGGNIDRHIFPADLFSKKGCRWKTCARL